VTLLEERALAWIEPYWNAEHLRRTRDWLLVIDPDADEGLRLAALTHDMERHFPGGPQWDPGRMAPGEPEYYREHAERSAMIVGEWLREQDAPQQLVDDVEALLLVHEMGGGTRENLLQAADSLSFLEVNPSVAAGWFTDGRCSRERSKEQLAYMRDRIQVERARELATALYERAIAFVDAA
jgi:hypothetical protein